MKNALRIGLVLSAVLLLVAVQANAGVIRTDNFTAQVNPDGTVTGGGSGWDNGRFVHYETGWWNEWFYNDPPMMPPQWKWITYDITVDPGTPENVSSLEIAINWSTLAWPATGPGGPPPGGIVPLTLAEEVEYIVRDVVYSGPVGGGVIRLLSSELEQGGRIVIPNNPEWVSIDIRLTNGENMLVPVVVNGVINHQCIPEPATLVSLVLGALALLFTRRR